MAKYDPETGEIISDYEYMLKYEPSSSIGAGEAVGLAKDVSDIAKNIGGDSAKEAGKDLAEEAMDWSPYAKGAELTAKTIGGVIDLENEQRKMNYLNEVAKYNAEQAKVDRATRVAQGLRA